MRGVAQLEWIDIFAYVSMTGSVTEPWESRTLLEMSKAYVRGLEEGAKPLSIMPSERG